MIRLLLPLALIGLMFWALRHATALPLAERRSFWRKFAALFLAGTLIALTVTGKLHWIGGLIGLLLPITGKALQLLLQLRPWVRKQDAEPESSADKTGNMSRDEALSTLGLEPNCSREEIIAAHKKLIQKLHPDKDGSSYLAGKVNQAKDVLLKSHGH